MIGPELAVSASCAFVYSMQLQVTARIDATCAEQLALSATRDATPDRIHARTDHCVAVSCVAQCGTGETDMVTAQGAWSGCDGRAWRAGGGAHPNEQERQGADIRDSPLPSRKDGAPPAFSLFLPLALVRFILAIIE